MKVFKRYFGGINLKPKTTTDGEKDLTQAGDIQMKDTDKRLYVHNGTNAKPILTENQIDSTLAGVDNLTVPGAKIVKDTIDAHVNSLTAHTAANLVNVPSGNLVATDVQSALNEIQTEVDGKALATDLTTANGKIDDLVTLSGVVANAEDLGTFTGVTIPDASDVKEALQSLETSLETDILALSTHISDTTTHGTVGNIVGTSDTQDLTNKTIDSDLNVLSNIVVTNFKTGVLDTDLTTVSLTDNTIPSAKATKAALDLKVGLTEVATLTNKSLVDNSTFIIDNTDATIMIKFNAAGTTATSTTLTGSQTIDRVLTLPDESDILATQTYTKTQAVKYAIVFGA